MEKFDRRVFRLKPRWRIFAGMVDPETEFYLKEARALLRRSQDRLQRSGDVQSETKESIYASLKLIAESRRKVRITHFHLIG